jgi:hypothetical protein
MHPVGISDPGQHIGNWIAYSHTLLLYSTNWT